MSKALDGVRILDFTHVQSGPTCTQLLAWMGADVVKVERVGSGDITRGQLRDIPDVDSLYFTMLNHNKRSITIDTKNPNGKAVLEALVKRCDVLVENFAPGVLDRMGLTWERIQSLNPRMIVASVKGFGPGPYEDCKVYENVAQCAGGSASTTGFDDGPPLVTGAQIGDSGTGLHLALGIVAALYQRITTGRGQQVLAAMQDGVLNLCRVKLRDQQRLDRLHVMEEYPQFPNGSFGEAVPRAGNASGGGQPGWILKCKGWETDPNAYIYFITQAPVWEDICKVIGEEGWITDPDYATPKARLPRLMQIFARIEEWTKTKTKFEAMDILNKHDIPCGPILSMKEIANEPSLRKTGTVVEVDHPTRGRYLTVGNPIKMSDSSKRERIMGATDLNLRNDTNAAAKAAVRRIIDQVKAEGRTSLTAPEGKLVCDAYGIAVPKEGVASSGAEAAKLATSMGFPVVLKIVSPEILHKTEAGGVLVGLKSADDVQKGYDTIVANAKKYNAKANLQGVQVQQMLAGGQEVIVGAVTDQSFGKLVAFGLGGVLVEVLKDITFRLAPATRDDALSMLDGVAAAEILKGVRGAQPVSREALADVIVNVSQLVSDFPEIAEMDLNPVFATPQGAIAADVRIVCDWNPAPARYRPSQEEIVRDMNRIMKPDAVAVIGASAEQGKIGHSVMKNLINGGYQGEIYPINPSASEIMGRKSYKSVKDVPGTIDVAVFAIPAK
ncbi:MAG: formyl-CoA transferase, partial [Betaproteobacteria bacterium]